MLRYPQRVLVSLLAMMAIGPVRGQETTYPVNRGDCNPGYHLETVYNGTVTFGVPPLISISQPGNTIQLCYENLPGSQVAGQPTPGTTPVPATAPAPASTPNSDPNAGIAAIKQQLVIAEKDLKDAEAAANAALAALEQCQRQESADADNNPDGIQHSLGYTGKGEGYDRHATVILKNPCQAQQQAWDAAYARFQKALQNVQHLQQALQELQQLQ